MCAPSMLKVSYVQKTNCHLNALDEITTIEQCYLIIFTAVCLMRPSPGRLPLKSPPSHRFSVSFQTENICLDWVEESTGA